MAKTRLQKLMDVLEHKGLLSEAERIEVEA